MDARDRETDRHESSRHGHKTRVKQAWTQVRDRDTSQAGMDTSKRQRPVKVRQER